MAASLILKNMQIYFLNLCQLGIVLLFYAINGDFWDPDSGTHKPLRRFIASAAAVMTTTTGELINQQIDHRWMDE